MQYFIRNGFTVTGIDSSSAMNELATKNNPLAEFRVMDLCHMDFPSNYFEGIWNVATLLHLGEADVKLAFREFRMVLKDDGTLYIATRTKDTSVSIIEESKEGGEIMVNYYSASKFLNSHGIRHYDPYLLKEFPLIPGQFWDNDLFLRGAPFIIWTLIRENI